MIFNGVLGLKRGLQRIKLWRKAFWHVLFARCAVSYSQDAEDLFLWACMAERLSNPGYKGFWVDIGAHDPARLSNTKMFYDIGWRGINVDPMPEAMEKFRRFRKRDINVNLGVGPSEGSMDYFMFRDYAFNTFDKGIADSRDGLREVRKIPMIRLDHLLDKYLPNGQHIDFLTVDAEGLDFEILKTNNWSKYRPDFVLAEIYGDDMDSKCHSDIVDYLNRVGYSLVTIGMFSAVFKLMDK